MSDPLLSVGEHPQSEPYTVGPCPTCARHAALQAVRDAFIELYANKAFPRGYEGRFDNEFKTEIAQMADAVSERAWIETMKGDYDYCPDHKPREDEDE